jgi:hypothetical protein
VLKPIRLDRQHQPLLIIDWTSVTCMPGTSNIALAQAHQRVPGPHIHWVIVGAFVRLPGRI